VGFLISNLPVYSFGMLLRFPKIEPLKPLPKISLKNLLGDLISDLEFSKSQITLLSTEFITVFTDVRLGNKVSNCTSTFTNGFFL
jgi:hypothetical protein